MNFKWGMKMRLDEDIKRAIKISRIEINKDEIVEQIKEIIQFFEMLDEIDVNNEVQFLPIEIKNVTRDDEIREMDWKLKDSDVISLGTKL